MADAVTKVAVVPFNMAHRHFEDPKERDLFRIPEMNYLRNLDDGMKSILFDETSPPEIKYQKYLEFLNKFATVMGNVKKPVEIEIKSKLPETLPVASSANSTTITRQRVNLESLGLLGKLMEKYKKPNDKEKVNKLLKALKEDPRINWDSKSGAIYFDRKRIEGSNITNTLDDFMKVRKKTAPGFTQVTVALARKKFPKEFIGNRKAYDEVLKNINKHSVRRIMGEYEEGLKEEGDEEGEEEYYSSADVTSEFVKKEEEPSIEDTLQFGSSLLRYKQTYW
jgi:mevalonate kinase